MSNRSLSLFAVIHLGVALGLVCLCDPLPGGEPDKPQPQRRSDYYGDPLPKGAVARLGMAAFPPVYGGSDLAFSADGKHVVTVDGDGQVRVWDAVTGELLRRRRLDWKPTADDQGLERIVLSPGARRVAVWDHERFYIFDTATGCELGRLDAVATDSFYPPLLIFAPDGKTLLVQRQTDRLAPVDKYLWHVPGGNEQSKRTELAGLEPRFPWITAAAFTPDGRRLFALADGLRVWDTATGREVGKPDKAFERVEGLGFAADGKTLAVGVSATGCVDLLDAATLKKSVTLKPPKKGKGTRLGDATFSVDGRLLAAVYYLDDRDQGVLIWDVREGKLLRRLAAAGCGKMVFSPDGKALARQGGNHEIVLRDAVTGRRRNPTPSHRGYVPAVAVSADGRMIASGDSNGELRLWDAATSRPVRAWKAAAGAIRDCWFAPNGKRLISLDEEGRLAAWETASGKEQWRETVPGGGSLVATVGFSIDGKHLLLAIQEGLDDTKIHLATWDAETGKRLRQRTCESIVRRYMDAGGVAWHWDHAVFVSDGGCLYALRGIQEVATGRKLTALPREIGSPAAFSPDGRYLVATLWESDKRNPLRFTPNGLTVRETVTGEEVSHWETGLVHYVAFTPDGRAVVTANRDELCVWDPATGRRWHRMSWPPPEESSEPWAPISWAVMPGGRLVTGMGGSLGTVLVWDLAPDTWTAAKPAGKLDRPKLEALWSDLTGNARTAYRATTELSSAGESAVSFLKQRLQPATVDAARLRKWIADLDSDRFEVREAASQELSRQRYQAEGILRQALEGKPSLEMRRRIETLLDGAHRPPTEALRTLRSIAVLERIGTPEARQVLQKLAGGAATAQATRAAADALRRLR